MRLKLTRIRQLFLLCIIITIGLIIVYSWHLLSSVGITIEKDCLQFCLGNACFSSRLAVLIYRKDVDPKDMDFKQNFRPKVAYGRYRYLVDHLLGRYDVESCSMDEGYFSQLTLIPPQNNCAVIGNGGILLHSSCGKEIDSYDYVIRVNVPQLIGFEDDVGYKTNITLMNASTLVRMHNNLTKKTTGDKLHDLWVTNVRRLNDSILWYGKSAGSRKHKLQQSAEVLKTKYQLPIRIAYSWRPLSPEKFGIRRLATTGFMAYYMATSVCQHITLYGFYPFSEDARGFHLPYHYDMDVPGYKYSNRVHNMPYEFGKFKEYEKEGKLRLVTVKCSDYKGGKDRKNTNKPIRLS